MLSTLNDFKQYFNLTEKEIEGAKKVIDTFPVRCTEYYASLANRNNPNDPIKKTVFPTVEELKDFLPDDPFKEEIQSPVPGLTHKYPDRVLIVATNYCPVLCRFCMRKRNWKKQSFVITKEQIDEITKYIKTTKVRDVLISGGEPLTIPDEILEYLILKLKEIETVDIVRIGSRLPVVAPNLLTEKKIKILERGEKVWLNTHFNHPAEVTKSSKEAVKKLLKAGIPVNNQTVLLKGINDNEETLYKLFSTLQRIKVRPYYLFRCDPVNGVFHFATSVEKGLEIMKNLKKKLSPLALPYYAVDTYRGKIILFPEGAEYKRDEKGYLFKVEDVSILLP
ncbi:KamA family radical SAM protein [Desulfurobacterium sp. TC5-1]|uniref:KamA family radical SAM protein n=1 Tax=Desulfurobacterium sp. TC5-1 TaxID=1158318 RepID=UPI0003B33918|nr:KamA family radical SAM protein [Desulfurobacterium sp. TC5-1]